MVPKFGNSTISIINSISSRFHQKNIFFLKGALFKFNILGLAQGKALKFYTSVEKWLKLKVRKFWRLILTFVENSEVKLEGKIFVPPLPILNRVKINFPKFLAVIHIEL